MVCIALKECGVKILVINNSLFIKYGVHFTNHFRHRINIAVFGVIIEKGIQYCPPLAPIRTKTVV